MSYNCPLCLTPTAEHMLVRGIDDARYALNRCPECLSAFSLPRPSAEKLARFYSSYDSLVKTNILESNEKREFLRGNLAVIEDCQERLSWIFHLAKIPANSEYLDIGCGYGFSVYAGETYQLNSSGIDYDGVAVSYGKNALDLKLMVSSLEEFEKNTNQKFSLITEWQVLEHVEDINSHLHSILNLLVSKGVYSGTVPNFGGIYSKLKKSKWYMIRPPEHLNYFTEKGLNNYFDKCGFDVLFMGTKFKTAAPLIQFGIRRKLNSLILNENTKGKWFFRALYRFFTLVKRNLFYFPLNLIICAFNLGGNSIFYVVQKK